MPVAGIICEYNPFHRAHSEHIARTRELLGADTGVVCVMGGNFLQRGEPAMFQKHARAEMALRGGADLVVELPLPWAIASAERFARGGVSILDGCGVVDAISFGSECGDVERLGAVASALTGERALALISEKLAMGVSYAAAREMAARELVGEESALLREPNNILAIEYLKAIGTLGSRLIPVTVKRILAEHDGGETDGWASALHIRERILAGCDVGSFVSDATMEIIRRETAAGRAPVTLKNAERAMLFRFRTMTDSEFEALPDSGEGLSFRFARAARVGSSYEEILDCAKCKRYAHSRLRRMAMAALLGVTAEYQEGLPPYIRVLGMNGRGREILREMKRRSRLPIITKPASSRRLTEEAQRIFMLEARAADIYSLLMPEVGAGGEEYRRGPVCVE